jgi:hypothetical protein
MHDYYIMMDGREQCRCPAVPTGKDVVFQNWIHYSDPASHKEQTVFGSDNPTLRYNYDDRLVSDKWHEGLKLAAEQAKPKTARFYEIALNHFHDTDTVDLQHVILGCNRSNGFSYLIFGYTYEPNPGIV